MHLTLVKDIILVYIKSLKSVLVYKDYRLLFGELKKDLMEKVAIELGLIKWVEFKLVNFVDDLQLDQIIKVQKKEHFYKFIKNQHHPLWLDAYMHDHTGIECNRGMLCCHGV